MTRERSLCTLFLGLVGLTCNDRAVAQSHFKESGRLIEHSVPSPLSILPDIVADLDGDLDNDILSLVVERSSQAHAFLYTNEGNGVMHATPGPQWIAWGFPVCGDFDRDGNLDVLRVTYTGQILGMLGLHNGSMVDTAFTAPPVTVGLLHVAAGDLDGDGWLDLVLTGHGLHQLFLGRPNHAFEDGTTALPDLPDGSTSSLAFDADGDGDLDLWIARTTKDRFYKNQNGSFFDASSRISQVQANTREVHPMDGDGDGDIDLVLLQDSLPTYLENQGSSFVHVPAAIPTFPVFNPFFRHLAVGDIDADGDPDIVLDQELQLRNGGSGRFSVQMHPPSLWRGRSSHHLADLDGDADLDMIDSRGHTLEIYLNDGTGLFVDGSSARPLSFLENTRNIAIGDLDSDGDLDVVCATAPGRRAYRNDGRGTFDEYPASLGPTLPTVSTDLGDANGDGVLDLLVTISSPPAIEVWHGQGNGSFTSTPSLPPTNGQPFVSRFIDLDRDGALDVVGSDAGGLLFLRNQGNGTFVLFPNPFPALAMRVSRLEAGDLDGDLDIDLVVGGSAFGVPSVAVLLNRSAFFTATTYSAGAGGGLALGDLDGDGDLDILSCGGFASDQWLRNDGSGGFTFAGSFGVLSLDIDCFDHDGDGDLDVVTTGAPPALYENDGTGRFQERANALPLLNTGQVLAVADFDRDGDPDLWMGAGLGSGDFQLWNPAIHLIERDPPRIGKRWSLELARNPNDPFALFASSSPRAIPFPPHGLLGLDPSSIQLVMSGALDPNGRTTLRFTIPNAPVLVGSSAFAQALIGTAAPRLSNTWEIRVTHL